MDTLLKVVQILSYLAGAFAAFWAVLVYRGNARRERARWAETLYSRFYVEPHLKTVRDLLDCSPDDPKVEDLVKKDSPDWTDYLNFFEFVQYLQVSKQLSEKRASAIWLLPGLLEEAPCRTEVCCRQK